MASGFLVLPDGRCFSKRWAFQDRIIEAVSAALHQEPEAQRLRAWLLGRIPHSPDDVELGFAWVRATDKEFIPRRIDSRLMNSEHQKLLCQAIKDAACVDHSDDVLDYWLDELADMVLRYERGEPPLSKSDWRNVSLPGDEPIDLG